MLKFGCILVYLQYHTLNLMPLVVYPKVLFGVNIHCYIQGLGSVTVGTGVRTLQAVGAAADEHFAQLLLLGQQAQQAVRDLGVHVQAPVGDQAEALQLLVQLQAMRALQNPGPWLGTLQRIAALDTICFAGRAAHSQLPQLGI